MKAIADEYQWNLYKKEHKLSPYNKTSTENKKVKKRNKKHIKSNLSTSFIYSKKHKEYIPVQNKKDVSQTRENQDDQTKIEHSLNISYEI